MTSLFLVAVGVVIESALRRVLFINNKQELQTANLYVLLISLRWFTSGNIAIAKNLNKELELPKYFCSEAWERRERKFWPRPFFRPFGLWLL